MLTAVALTAGGVLAVAQSASATPVPSYTKVWFGKAGGYSEPDAGYASRANAVFEFKDPASLEVEAGDEISIDVTGACWINTSEDRAPELTFELGGESAAVSTTGDWTSGFDQLSHYSGTVSFTMPEEAVTLHMKATGSDCIMANSGSELSEDVYSFTIAQPPTEPAGPSTSFWYGKSDDVAQPDPADESGPTGIVTILDPASVEVDRGTEVTLQVSAQCWSGVGQIALDVDGTREWVDGTWFDGGFTGSASFTLDFLPAEVRVMAWDTDCFADEINNLNELAYTFTVPEIECPELPGFNLYDSDGDWDYVVENEAAGYSSNWYLNDDGSIDSVGNDWDYQGDAFDDFSAFASTAADDSDLIDECVHRDEDNADDWGTGTLGDLDVTTQNHYFPTADLGRRAWTFTNSTGVPVDGFDVTIRTDFESDGDTELVSQDDWGVVTGDGGEDTPVVTVLWGGADSTVDETAEVLPAAPIGDDYADATADSTAWLHEFDTVSSAYFDGVIGDSILNWGDEATDPDVWLGARDAEDSDVDDNKYDDLATTYYVPSLADGDSVTIVEFAHVQYYEWTEPEWVDTTVANGVIGVAYEDEVNGPEDQSYYYWLDDGDLPDGLELDSDTGAITGTPKGPKGCSLFTVGVETDGSDSFKDFTICITEPVVPVDPEQPQQPALLLGLVLDFEVGDSIIDAGTTSAANGLRADSDWTLTMHSEPRVIGSGQTDEDGSFSKLVDLPLDTPAGAHELVLAGIAPSGAAVEDRAWFALDERGIITAISYDGPVTITIPAAEPTAEDVLASTGAEFAAPGIAAAVLALLTGGGLLIIRRRRLAS